MAQVSFTKLNIKIHQDVKIVYFNEQEIEVKQYLPISEKFNLINAVLNASPQDVGYYNPGYIDVLTALNIVFYYTNIKFTDKQKEDTNKLYDQLMSSGFVDQIYSIIPQKELEWIKHYLQLTIDQFYKYKDSVLGILDSVNADYSNLNFSAENIQNNLADPENLTLLKDVITKLG